MYTIDREEVIDVTTATYPVIGEPIHPVHCRRCHMTWRPSRAGHLPRICTRCKSYAWNQWPEHLEASVGIRNWHRAQGHRVSLTVDECPTCQQLLTEEGTST
jgi:hypothetical protein